MSILEDYLDPMEGHYEMPDELNQIHEENIAIHHYIITLMRRSFMRIKHENRLILMGYWFNQWKNIHIQTKIARIYNLLMRNRINHMMRYAENKKKSKNIASIKQELAISHHHKAISSRYFYQFVKEHQLSKKEFQVKRYLKQVNFLQFISIYQKCHQQNQDKCQSYQILDEMRNKKILRQIWEQIKLFIMINKAEKCRRKHRFKQIIQNMQANNKLDHVKCESFRNKIIFKKIFAFLHQNALNQRSIRFYHHSTLIKCFKRWRGTIGLPSLTSSRNQTLLQQHLKRRFKIIVLSSFQHWKHWVQHHLQTKQQNAIIQQYAQVKGKQALLRCSWNALVDNIQIQKMNRYYNRKLKTKIIEILKERVINKCKIMDKLYALVKYKELGRYFKAILSFNQQQNHKKAYDSFTLRLATEYYRKITLANKFHAQSLMFKTIVAFKQALVIKQNQKYLILYLNVIKVLRSWRVKHRVSKYIAMKKWRQLKKIMFQWKLLKIAQNRHEWNANTSLQRYYLSPSLTLSLQDQSLL